MATKKPAKKSMGKKSMKKTKGGLLPYINVAQPSNTWQSPAQQVREAAIKPLGGGIF